MKRQGTRIPYRNPAVGHLVPLALIAGGAYLLLRKKSAPVEGMGDLGRSFRSVASSVSHSVSNAVSSVPAIVKTVAAPIVAQVVAAPTILKAALPLAATLTPGGALLAAGSALLPQKAAAEEAPAQGGGTVYQDENENPITEAEYNRRMAEIEAAKKAASEPVYQDANGNPITKAQYDQLLAMMQAQGVTTPPSTSTTVTGAPIKRLPPLPPKAPEVIPQPREWQQQSRYEGSPAQRMAMEAEQRRIADQEKARAAAAAQAISYQAPGGASPSDYTLPPAYTPPTQQAAAPAYAPIQEAAPSDAKKINPALAVGVVAAVPLLFMLGAK